MKLAIIKYNAGNIQSVIVALERLGVTGVLTNNAEEIAAADKVIFPGVGEASSAMRSLKENGLDQVIKDLEQPVLGICVGMQLLCRHSQENDTNCLNIIPIEVKKFKAFDQSALKVPQVGWNNIYNLKTKLFNDVDEQAYIYNVHSYYATLSEYAIATCNYGVEYAAAINKDNFYGVQFHTEKSAGTGDKIISNFLELS